MRIKTLVALYFWILEFDASRAYALLHSFLRLVVVGSGEVVLPTTTRRTRCFQVGDYTKITTRTA